MQDWRKHNVTNYAYGVIKFFVLCHYEDGAFSENIETTGIGFFGKEELPQRLANEKCTREQIEMCFRMQEDPVLPTLFD